MIWRRSLLAAFALAAFAGCAAAGDILLQSTTSTRNSGLYDHLLPMFTADSGVTVRVVAVGTGQALKNARNGDADVLLVHAKSEEERFVDEGWGVARHDLMYNDFVLIGPREDPAGVRQAQTAAQALDAVAAADGPFVSRGDDSGTHKKERALWRGAHAAPDARATPWYLEVGAGMGATINVAVQTGGYTLTDRATWAAFGAKRDHVIVFEGDAALHNQYGVIAVNPERHPHVNHAAAEVFVQWLLSERGQAAIASFQIDGAQMFFPNATTD